MGASESKSNVEITNELITNSMNNMFVSQLQSHRISAAVIQTLKVKAKGDINIGTINMTSLVNVKLDSWQKMQNKTEIQRIVEQALQQQSEAQAQAEQSFLTVGNSNAEVNQNIRNSAINSTVNNIDVKQVNECLASAYTKQSIDLESTNGNVTITAIDMNATAKVAAKCVADTVQQIYTSQLERYTNEQSGQASSTSVNKGIFESLGELVGQVISALGSIITGPMRFVMYGIVALIILSIVVSVAKSFMSGGGNSASSEGVYDPTYDPSGGVGVDPSMDMGYDPNRY